MRAQAGELKGQGSSCDHKNLVPLLVDNRPEGAVRLGESSAPLVTTETLIKHFKISRVTIHAIFRGVRGRAGIGFKGSA